MQVRQPDARLHKIMSMAKSSFRIIGCVLGIVGSLTGSNEAGLYTLSYWLLGAEIVGIFEEMV